MKYAFVAVLVALTVAVSAQGQTNITSADIERLQQSAADASRDVNALGPRDAALKSDLQAALDDARDEITYLRVKIRKNEPTMRSEYTDLRDRIDRIRDRAHGETTAAVPPPVPTAAPRPSNPDELPVGTEFDVRLQTALSSATAQVEDQFAGTTIADIKQGDRVLVPAGSAVRGVVSSVKKAGRIDRTGSLTVAFDRVTINGRTYPIRATVTQAFESEGIKGDAGKIGAGAGVGALVGALLGGGKGALAGILVGGGGTIAATEGKDVELQPATVLRGRLDTPLNVR